MSRYSFIIIDINELAWGEEEYLHDSSSDSAVEAIRKCLDPAQKGDLLQVTVKHAERVVDEGFSPYAHWGSLENFNSLLTSQQLMHKIQLNVDVDEVRAAEDLLVSAIESRQRVQN